MKKILKNLKLYGILLLYSASILIRTYILFIAMDITTLYALLLPWNYSITSNILLLIYTLLFYLFVPYKYKIKISLTLIMYILYPFFNNKNRKDLEKFLLSEEVKDD